MAGFVLNANDVVPIKNTQSSGYTELTVGAIAEQMSTNNWGNAFVLVDLGDSKPGLYIRFFIIPGDTAYLGTKEYINNGYWIGVQGSNGNNVYERTTRLIGWDGSKLWISSNQAYFDSKLVDGIAYECVGGNLANYGNQQAFYLPSTISTIFVDNVPYGATATVRVTCNIPKDPDYKYVKLTYKKDTRPDSWEDGSSIDITKNARTIDIPSLDIGSNYWFTIFTDISESESFPFTIN